MNEPWLLIQGTDDEGSFIVKLNGRFREPPSRVGLPIRQSLIIEGRAAVRPLLGDEQQRGAIEEAFYEYARRKGGALVATIARAERYTYVLQLPSGVDSSAWPIPDAIKAHFRIDTSADAGWDEYCGYLYARQVPPSILDRLRRVFRRRS